MSDSEYSYYSESGSEYEEEEKEDALETNVHAAKVQNTHDTAVLQALNDLKYYLKSKAPDRFQRLADACRTLGYADEASKYQQLADHSGQTIQRSKQVNIPTLVQSTKPSEPAPTKASASVPKVSNEEGKSSSRKRQMHIPQCVQETKPKAAPSIPSAQVPAPSKFDNPSRVIRTGEFSWVPENDEHRTNEPSHRLSGVAGVKKQVDQFKQFKAKF